MSTPGKNTFENLISGKVKDHESEYSDDAWKDMQLKLDAAKNPFFALKFKRSGQLVSLVFVLMAISFLSGYEFWKHTENHSSMQVSMGYKGSIISGTRTGSIQIQTQSKIPVNALSKSFIINPLKNKKSLTFSTRLYDKSIPSNSLVSANSYKIGRESVASKENMVLERDHKNNGLNFKSDKRTNEYPFKTDTEDTQNTNMTQSLSSKPDKKLQSDSYLSANDMINNTDRENRPISFGSYIGFNMDMVYYYQGGGLSSEYSYGAFINYSLTDKLSLQSGLGYQTVSENILKSDTIVDNSDSHGKVYNVTGAGTTAIGYLNLPLILKYSLGRKFRVTLGPQISYALSAPVWVNTVSYKKDNAGNYQPVVPIDSSAPPMEGKKISDFSSDIYHFSLEMQIGFQWDMSRSFDLSFIYFRQLTDVLKTKNGYIGTQSSIYNNTIQLRLGYKLFSKKFHED